MDKLERLLKEEFALEKVPQELEISIRKKINTKKEANIFIGIGLFLSALLFIIQFLLVYTFAERVFIILLITESVLISFTIIVACILIKKQKSNFVLNNNFNL